MSRPRRTRLQGVSCAPGHLTKTMAPPVMTAPETMVATVAAAMTMVTSARFLQSSVVDSQAPTGGSVSIDVSS
jgi:hypothetical protein